MSLRLPGFRFQESMYGSAHIGGKARDMAFHISAEANDLLSFFGSGRVAIAGSVTVAGVAHDTPLCGSLWILPFSRRLRYEFGFRADDGRELFFVGQKDVSVFHLWRTMTDLPGKVRREDGQFLGMARLRFRKRDLPSFLWSFRPLPG